MAAVFSFAMRMVCVQLNGSERFCVAVLLHPGRRVKREISPFARDKTKEVL